jgi:hypothetical protein
LGTGGRLDQKRRRLRPGHKLRLREDQVMDEIGQVSAGGKQSLDQARS